MNGKTSASAGITALTVDLPQMKLSGLIDQLTHNLQQQLQQLLSTLGSATPAARFMPQLSLAGLTLPTSLTSLVGGLLTEVNALPTGQALNGLSTLGLNATMASITSTASFVPSGSPTQAVPTSTTTPPGAVPTPATPSPNPKLPLTGTNEIGTIAAGFLLLVAGYYLLVVSEQRRGIRAPNRHR
jgi:hypothetical protein